MLLYRSHKILYTWQVAGVGAGLIAKKFFGRAHPLEALLNGSALRALGDLLISFIFFSY
jgi:hypothetical protein